MADNLTAFSWLSLIVFAIVIFFCIHPLRVPIPFTHGRFGVSHIWLDIATAPIVGILVLLATTSINGLVLRDGIVGSEHGIQPYSVVLLIFALAYICISIDVTGFFEYVAFQVTKRGGSSGHRLFLYLFLLSTIMTIFTSNDVVVLTITPIVCYLTQETKTDPKAYLVSTFIVCNIASLALYIGNPTNIIVAQAFRINFIQYSAWMGLPTLLAVGLAYLMCFVVLRSHIPVNIPSPPPEAEERYQIRDRWGAFIGCAVLLACLLGLMIVPIFADVPVWMLTLPFGAIMIGKDMIMDLTRNCRPQKTEHENIELGSGGTSEVRMLRRESSNEQNVSLSSESVENKECLIESKDASAEDNISVEMNGTHSGPTNSVRTERNSVASASSRVPAPSRSRLGSRQGSSLAEVESCDGSDLLVEETRKKSSIVSRMSAWSNALPTVYHVTRMDGLLSWRKGWHI
ncbi:hypothetical protein, variant [Spizellomyces punctatus DAOM BR117]|uniref:Citrate transporter-like domain-containing protein n=1 Tax=Spizellomyces punctatus (strain DAOM BR117) TaxID=645134 RepID=A0A0L0HK45_SPIPD|nr:hypothetical protein, variant [Spizellomyces punctatus DAOM BR117]KND01194.1 hypothetical protein, variant [Spizellomyces punctatus DAOM BR117]|eukprot:XP_016609233.1 hypothetical protein, variant [Spizellomyces punctatus DAOM BR117]